MNTTNRTIIAAQVKALFTLDLDTKIFNMEVVPFIADGVIADQEYRALVSMIYTVRSDIVRLMNGDDKPLQDVDKPGALGTSDNGTVSDFEIERGVLLASALRCHAVLERHSETLAEKARKDSEEAGRKTDDGGRYRIARKGREFRGYLNTWDEFLLDLKSKAVAGTAWAIKIAHAEELVFPMVSAQCATDEYLEYFEDENVTKVSLKAWDKLLDAAETYGTLLIEHERTMGDFNELPKEFKERAKSEIAIENVNFRQESRNSEYWINRFLEPWALLCHTGAPKALVDSPEWRTAAAYKRVSAAKAKVAEVNAQALELEAMNAEAEAYEALSAARKRMAALAARNEALMNGTPEPKVEIEASSEEVMETIKAAGTPKNGGIKPVGLPGFPSYTHR